MGRTSTITQEHVSNAVGELLALGQKPTARAVRAKLGRGSMDNVLRHLQALKPGTQPQAGSIPGKTNDALLDRSADLLATDNANLLAQIGGLQQALGKALAQVEVTDELRREIEVLKGKLAVEEGARRQAEKNADQMESASREWQLRNQHAQFQLNEAKDRIQRLERSERDAIERAARVEARASAQ